MRRLTVYRRYFYQADAYTRGRNITMRGVQVHSTGANNTRLKRYVQPDDGRIGKNTNGNDHNRPGLNTCAGAYIGRQSDGTVAAYLTLPVNRRVWLSGSGKNGNGNDWLFGFEICQDDFSDRDYFEKAVREVSVNLTAWLCMTYGVTPYDTVRQFGSKKVYAVCDHAELHAAGCGSNHGDISDPCKAYGWLSNYGYTMDDYRAWVSMAIMEGVEVNMIDCDEQEKALYEATVTCSGKYLNLREGKSTDTRSIYQLYKGTAVSVLDDNDPYWWRVRQDGITGYAMAISDKGEKWLTKNGSEPVPVDPGEYKLTQAEKDALNMAADIILKFVSTHS